MGGGPRKEDCVEPNLRHAVLLVAAGDGAIGH